MRSVYGFLYFKLLHRTVYDSEEFQLFREMCVIWENINDLRFRTFAAKCIRFSEHIFLLTNVYDSGEIRLFQEVCTILKAIYFLNQIFAQERYQHLHPVRFYPTLTHTSITIYRPGPHSHLNCVPASLLHPLLSLTEGGSQVQPHIYCHIYQRQR